LAVFVTVRSYRPLPSQKPKSALGRQRFSAGGQCNTHGPRTRAIPRRVDHLYGRQVRSTDSPWLECPTDNEWFLRFPTPPTVTLRGIQRLRIDARLVGNYADFDGAAVARTRTELRDPMSAGTEERVQISGTVGPRYGEGQAITLVFFHYGPGAIVAEYSDHGAHTDLIRAAPPSRHDAPSFNCRRQLAQ